MAERPSFEPSPAVPEPSPAARELLRAFREHESPSTAERELGFAALRTRLEVDEAFLGGRSGSSASAPKAFEPPPAANGHLYTMVRATLVTVAVAATVLLAIKAVSSGVTALADRARQPAMEAPYQGEAGSDGGQAVTRAPRVLPPGRSPAVPTGTSVPAVHEAVVIDPTVHEATVHEGPPPGQPASASAAAARPPRPRPSPADDLDAELALIKRATEAKTARRFADGLAALREHAQRFPRGLLADERTVLKAELHCAAGRVQEADALVEEFLREHPGHALTGRMRNVCRE
jgi:hypothetical protein